MDSDWQQRAHIILVLVAVLLFNFPLMAIADQLRHCCGASFLPLYLFAGWAGLIILAAIVSARGQRR